MKTVVCLLFFGWSLISIGQDGKNIFTEDQLIDMINQYHPISVQSKLLVEQGESMVQRSKGALDPKLKGDYNQKRFDGKNYFSILGAGFEIPTLYGIDFKAGYDQTNGDFLNPENNLPQSGLIYGGVSVPIGQGLFIDKRRAVLKQAQIYANATKIEQQVMMNDLYFNAIKHYWKWAESWNKYQIYEISVLLAKTRFEAVKQSYLLGDKPAIDTLEAYIQYQTRTSNKNEYQLIYQNAALELSNFLWFENNTPLKITDSLFAPEFEETSFNNIVIIDSTLNSILKLENTHPEMLLYDYKLNTLNVEKRLKQELLKPKLNINYNLLNEPIGSDLTSELSINNYKWGVELEFPIFLRKQRGDLALTNQKIKSTELGQQNTLLKLKNFLESQYNEQKTTLNQVILFQSIVSNYKNLLNGEKQKFYNGESSLFLINSREKNLIGARLKLAQLISRYNISNVSIRHAQGLLYNDYK